ncbi:MAG: elongation factor P maturation arginine rhamnosyltransferase EarP [Candidatus Gracilibacteria bacterium]
MYIDILIHVCDNLGDMGFATELTSHLAYSSKNIDFRFYTDDRSTLEKFFSLQNINYPIFSKGLWHQHDHSETRLFLILFRTDFDVSYVENLPIGVATLWVDYLTFDPNIALLNGQEHIRSSRDHPIIHIVNSPLGGGLLPLLIAHHSSQDKQARLIACQEWKNHLPYTLDLEIQPSSKMVTIFSYNTQKHVQEICGLDWFVVGFTPIAFPQFLQSGSWVLPYVSIDQFYTLIGLSDVVIVRGEVSLAATLQLGAPFYWDMYKEKGGWNVHEFESFLSWISLSFDHCGESELFRFYNQSSRVLNEQGYIGPDDIEILMTEGAKKVFHHAAKRASERSLAQTILAFIGKE